jgi:hypothetical protein
VVQAFRLPEGPRIGALTAGATFTTSYTGNNGGDVIATIDWGDATTPTAGRILADGRDDFEVEGTHIYSEYTYTDFTQDSPFGNRHATQDHLGIENRTT